MIIKEIDFENDHLIIYKKLSGEVIRYQWESSKRHPPEEIQALIIKWNNEHKESGDTVELITDKYLKEICAYAYKQYATALRSSADEAKEVMGDIDNAVEQLESALDDLKRIKGLD
jgi:hypothetical protein